MKSLSEWTDLDRGYTLAELLIAVTLVGIVAGAAYRGLSLAEEYVRRWQAQRALTTELHQVRVAFVRDVGRADRLIVSGGASGTRTLFCLQDADTIAAWHLAPQGLRRANRPANSAVRAALIRHEQTPRSLRGELLGWNANSRGGPTDSLRLPVTVRLQEGGAWHQPPLRERSE